MKAKIFFRGKTKSNKDYIIRYPVKEDANLMRDYINKLSKERTFIRFQGEKISLREETKYLHGQLKKIKDQKAVQLVVVCDKKIMGIAEIDLKDKTESHEGFFGISLAKEIRGEGIGKKLMQLTLNEAEKNLPALRIITLGVFGNNTLAQLMYKKLGFREYGRLPKGILHRKKYVDHIYMYKPINLY